MDNKILVEKALKLIDRGFDKMDREVKNPSKLDYFLIGSVDKTLYITESIMLLCEKGYSQEAMILLRSLIELTINIRWITNKDTNARLNSYLDELKEPTFGSRWASKNIKDRAKELNFNEDYYDFVIKFTYGYSHVNAQSLNLGRLITKQSKRKNISESVLVVSAQMLGHMMLALNSRYKSSFSEYNEIWSGIKPTKNIKDKYNQLLREQNAE